VLVTGSLAATTTTVRSYERILWMGGSLGEGNITPEAEFNAWCAPDAADEVLRSSAAVTTVVPLDVTRRVVVDPDDLSGGATASLLADALRGRSAAPVHDAVAAVAWLRPDLFTWDELSLRCQTADDRRGALLTEGPGPTRVAVDLDARTVRGLIVEAVGRGP
jgi:pyrimidine-specific ribonucleoside hydrolase